MPAQQTPVERPGIKTTEFWLSLATLAGGVGLILGGHEEAGQWLCVAAVSGYAVGRGLTKAGR